MLDRVCCKGLLLGRRDGGGGGEGVMYGNCIIIVEEIMLETLKKNEVHSIGGLCVCVCESYIGKPIGTRAVPQFTTGVAKPLTQIEPGKTEHHPPA